MFFGQNNTYIFILKQRFIYKYTYIFIKRDRMVRRTLNKTEKAEQFKEIESLFRKHLQDHHHIETQKELEPGLVKEHLEGKQTLIPLSIFSNKRLSALEAIVKYLRENEQLRNTDTAQLLGRSSASVWITYRNAAKKMYAKLSVEKSDLFIPTSALSGKLSALESISTYLRQEYGLSYRRIGKLLNRDERTIWTVCSRAMKKLAK